MTFALPTSLAQDEAPGKTSVKLSVKILVAVRQNPQIIIAELAALLGISTRSVERQLQNDKRLARIGAAKGRDWQVVDP